MANNNLSFNTAYLSTNRGIIKILQIIFGLICCSLLCGNWYGGQACFYNDGRMGFVSAVNFVIVIINIVMFVLNLLNVAVYRMERIYTIVGMILFIIAFALLLWFLLEYSRYPSYLLAATVFIGIQMGLFIWDYQILHGSAYN